MKEKTPAHALLDVLARRWGRRPKLDKQEAVVVKEILLRDGQEAAEAWFVKRSSPVERFLDKMAEERGGARPRLPSNAFKTLGKAVKKGEEAARIFVSENEGPTMTQPPTKCNIIAQSRPFSEWLIVQVGETIQRAVYGLPYHEFKRLQAIVKVLNEENRVRFFVALGVTLPQTLVHAQALNLIIKHALSRYEGVVQRLTNANEGRQDRHDSINAAREASGQDLEPAFEPRPIFNEGGSLEEPPGINPNLYCYSQISPVLYDPNKDPVQLPPEYADYKLPTAFPSLGDRLDIPKGEPGYVPEWQREKLSLNKHRRKRAWYARAKLKRNRQSLSPEREELAKKARTTGAVLAIIRIGEDWAVFDVRGSIRNAHWRRLINREMLPKDILWDKDRKTGLLTGDPVVDTRKNRGTITLLYRPGVTGIEKQSVRSLQEGYALLTKMTEIEEVAVVAIDLGQTNPVAAGIFRVRQEGGQLIPTRMGGDTYWWGLQDEPLVAAKPEQPRNLKEAALVYRKRCNALERRLDQAAIDALSPEHQTIFREFHGDVITQAQQHVCQHLGLEPSSLPWEEMGPNTEVISRAYLACGGDPSKVTFTHDPKSKRCKVKTCKHSLSNHSETGCGVSGCSCDHPHKSRSKTKVTKIRKDHNWSQHLRPRLPQEVREVFSKVRWDLQRQDPTYQQLVKEKTELARRTVNAVLRRTKHLTQCDKIVVVIEDLVALNKFFSGKGQRKPGWEGFFQRKSENLWLVKAFHKALSSLPEDKGIPVIAGWPARTSITCPACRTTDRESRRGEHFCCTACHRNFHADGEVATFNICHIALTGVSIPKPCERSDDATNHGAARKRKSVKSKEISDQRSAAHIGDGQVE